MPTLLRVDNKTINLDLVFEIDDYGDRVRLYYAVSSNDTNGNQQPSYSELRGQAADDLRRYLARVAIDTASEADGGV